MRSQVRDHLRGALGSCVRVLVREATRARICFTVSTPRLRHVYAPPPSAARVSPALMCVVSAPPTPPHPLPPASDAEEWALAKFNPDGNGLVTYAALLQATRTRGVFDARRLNPEERDALLFALDPRGFGTVQGASLVAFLRSDRMPIMRRSPDDRWGLGIGTRVSVDYHASGRRYPATVVSVHPDGTYGVLYDDDERERVPLSRVATAPTRDAVRVDGGVYSATVPWKGGVLLARVVAAHCSTGLGRSDFSAPWCELSLWPSDDASRAGPSVATPFARSARAGEARWGDDDELVRMRVWPPPPRAAAAALDGEGGGAAAAAVPLVRPHLALKLRRRWLRGADGHVEELASGVVPLSDVLYEEGRSVRRRVALDDGEGEVELELQYVTAATSGGGGGRAGALSFTSTFGAASSLSNAARRGGTAPASPRT